MSIIKTISGLPALPDIPRPAIVRTQGNVAILRCDQFLVRFSLLTGSLDWLVEHQPQGNANSVTYSRYINLYGASSPLWLNDQIVAELCSSSCGGMIITARDIATGKQLWEQLVPIPAAVAWTESKPAWSGASTEELYGFFAKDSQYLVLCITRHTRRSMIYSADVIVDSLPPFECQTDAWRFDPASGKCQWSNSYPGVSVGILERQAFTGHWARSPRVGVIDLKSGTNTILAQLPETLGWPLLDGPDVAIPWHSKKEAGVTWVSPQGQQVAYVACPAPRLETTCLHRNGAGLALQTNNQGFWWFGQQRNLLWNIKAKPYIYRVHGAPETDVFVGTDGNGGRLLGFDAQTGQETLNLRPSIGGVGDLAKVEGHAILACSFQKSRTYNKKPGLLLLSMQDKEHAADHECFQILSSWEHGVVCRAGKRGEQLAVVDVR